MSRSWRGVVLAGLLVAVVLAVGVSRFASTEPDGLEKVAADHALDAGERPHALADSPLADYAVRGVDDPGLARGAAGLAGVALTFVVAGGLVWVAGRASRPRPHAPSAVLPQDPPLEPAQDPAQDPALDPAQGGTTG